MPQRRKVKGSRAERTHLVDTNVIVRFLIGDDAPKAAKAVALMERVGQGEETISIPT